MGNGTNTFSTILEIPAIARIRRNHGLEHATLRLLQEKYPRRSLAGHSDTGGFWLLGDVETDVLRQTVGEAQKRLLAGEHDLAIHPNCGTNFVTAGLLAGGAAFMALVGARRMRDRLERLPLAATFATLALMVAQPLGFLLQQEITTSAQIENLEVVEVIPNRSGRVVSHRVMTRN